MTVVEFVVLLVIAGVCGSIAQAMVGFTRGGCLVSVALGFIGALVGPMIAGSLGLPELFTLQIGDQTFPIIWSIIGAIVVGLIIGLLSPRPRR
jgi:uncharacterized membrane protein YeaQ/YmgE (transglycosylase-associated protein family)